MNFLGGQTTIANNKKCDLSTCTHDVATTQKMWQQMSITLWRHEQAWKSFNMNCQWERQQGMRRPFNVIKLVPLGLFRSKSPLFTANNYEIKKKWQWPPCIMWQIGSKWGENPQGKMLNFLSQRPTFSKVLHPYFLKSWPPHIFSLGFPFIKHAHIEKSSFFWSQIEKIRG